MLCCSWAFIADRLPGRTDNAVKNRWNQHLKNKLIGRGIDHQNIPDPQSSTGDQPHAIQLFHLDHNINPNAGSSSIPFPVSTSQEIVNPLSTSELAYPEFSGDIFRVMMRLSITLSGEITLGSSPHNSFTSTTTLIQTQAQAQLLHRFQRHKKSPTLGPLLN